MRDIYAFPGRPDRLIKVIVAGKRDAYAARRGTARGRIEDALFGPYRTFQLEFKTYLAAMVRAERLDLPNPIAAIDGIVRTTEGLGQVVEMIPRRGGGLAPTLRHVLNGGRFDGGMVDALNDLVALLDRLAVPMPDLTANNIVWHERRSRFVVVDGFGEKTVLPVREWIPALSHRRRGELLGERLGRFAALTWEPDRRRFSLTP